MSAHLHPDAHLDGWPDLLQSSTDPPGPDRVACRGCPHGPCPQDKTARKQKPSPEQRKRRRRR